MNGATASLFDRELAATLREAFARPGIEKLKNEIGGAGEKQLQAVLAKATAPTDKTRQWFEAGACFVAGTQVHTKEGLVPIEKLKIGDWVLSRPEDPSQGSELAYKRVLKTLCIPIKKYTKFERGIVKTMMPVALNLWKYIARWITLFGWMSMVGLRHHRSPACTGLQSFKCVMGLMHGVSTATSIKLLNP